MIEVLTGAIAGLCWGGLFKSLFNQEYRYRRINYGV